MPTPYRRALRLRRTEPGFGEGEMSWLLCGEDVRAFTRPHGLLRVVNLSARSVELPSHVRLLMAGGRLGAEGLLRPDTGAWLRV
jgi:alpha-glucosidase